MPVFKDFFGNVVAQSAPPTTTYTGSAGDEPLTGGLGADLLVGGGAGHVMTGLGGDDTYQVNTTFDAVVEAPGAGVDTVQVRNVKTYALGEGLENLYLFGKMTGYGNAGDNLIVGNINAQVIVGGAGNDVLVGGAGADTFVFGLGSGKDVVTDFTSGQSDKVRIEDYGFVNFAQVKAAMTQVGADVVLQLSSGDAVKFLGKTIDSFQASDFQLQADPSSFRIAFADEFDGALSLYDPATGSGTWKTSFSTGDDTGVRAYNSHTLRNNGEKQLYVDANFAGTGSTPLGANPFAVDNGVLTISARPTTDAEKQNLWFYKYASGLLTTAETHTQTYGYFEVRAQLPSGQGVWPAFWLLPTTLQTPPELDVFEQIGGETVYFTSHSAVAGVSGSNMTVTGATSGFHTYGLLWTNKELTWYVDGQAVRSIPTPTDMNSPMYMLVNLAVGGSFPGSPADDFTGAEYKIDYVKSYTLDALNGIDGDLGFRFMQPKVGLDGKAAVAFEVTGLDVGTSGVVTFTDSLGATVTVAVGANGAGVADLTALGNGKITAVVSIDDPAGGVISGGGDSVSIDPGFDSDLKVTLPDNLGAAGRSAAAFDLAGLNAGQTATITFTDKLGGVVTKTATANGAFTVDLSSLGDGQVKVDVRTDATLAGEGGKFGLDTTADELSDLQLALPGVTPENRARFEFSVLGLDRDAGAVVTFADTLGHSVSVAVNSNSSPFVDLTGLSGGVITASIKAVDEAGNTAAPPSQIISLDSTADEGGDLTLTLPSTSVSAYAKTYAPFVIGGLDADATATVRFTDSAGGAVQVTATTNGQFRVDLSGLAAGPVTATITASDAAGNTAAGVGRTLTLAPGVVSQLIGNTVIMAGESGGPLNGTTGADLFVAGPGGDAFAGGAGGDTVTYEAAAAGVSVDLDPGPQRTRGSGTDSLSSIENLIGSRFGDSLTGDSRDNVLLGGDGGDVLAGGDGNDLIGGGAGADILSGGYGDDTATYFDAASAVTVNLSLVLFQNTGGGGWDLLNGFENLVGSDFNDVLTGNSRDNRLDGGAGADVLNGGQGSDRLLGGAGADTLIGGSGRDVLTGGEGADVFQFGPANAADADVVSDFQHGLDHLAFKGSDYRLAAGSLDPSYLVSGTGAVHNLAEFVFDAARGLLSWDPDGVGGRSLIAVATLAPGTVLTAADFLIL